MDSSDAIILARSLLEKNACLQQCISYKDFANVLNIIHPPVIASVTSILEKLTEEDVNQKKPILAALVIQKGSKKVPRLGFFEKLVELNIIESYGDGFDEITWHAEELKKLKVFYHK